MDHFRNVFDGDHLSFKHRKNFGQCHSADLHVAEGKLFARNFACEIVHEIFFTGGEAFDNAAFLPLERLAFEYLRDAAAQKIDAGLHIFFEGIGLSARKGEQARPVGNLEIVDVAAVGGFFSARVKFADHTSDGAAATGAGKSANENVIAGRGKLNIHFHGAQSAFLSHKSFAEFRLRRGFEG